MTGGRTRGSRLRFLLDRLRATRCRCSVLGSTGAPLAMPVPLFLRIEPKETSA